MTIEEVSEKNRADLMLIIKNTWGDEQIISKGKTFDCRNLPGFIALEDNNIIGYLIYSFEDDYIEIVLLASIEQLKGIGRKLIQKVEDLARRKNVNELRLVSTNDNAEAFIFYQKCGFRMTNILPNAVTMARKIKPSIPVIGLHGIEIRDEVEFIKKVK